MSDYENNEVKCRLDVERKSEFLAAWMDSVQEALYIRTMGSPPAKNSSRIGKDISGNGSKDPGIDI